MNLKRIEFMVEDVNENLQNHLLNTKNTYYYVMQQNGASGELAVRFFTSGGKTECEVIAMPDYSLSGEVQCRVLLDGVELQVREGVITLEDIEAERGYHTLEFFTSPNVASARVRLTGDVSFSSILSL